MKTAIEQIQAYLDEKSRLGENVFEVFGWASSTREVEAMRVLVEALLKCKDPYSSVEKGNVANLALEQAAAILNPGGEE